MIDFIDVVVQHGIPHVGTLAGTTHCGCSWVSQFLQEFCPGSILSHLLQHLTKLILRSSECQTWGVTISASILQNELKHRLPTEFISQFPQGAEIAYAAIPVIPTLPEPTRTQVHEAFASSLSVVWKAMIGFSAAGFVTLLFIKEIPMHRYTDDTYGLKSGGVQKDEEQLGTLVAVPEVGPSSSSNDKTSRSD